MHIINNLTSSVYCKYTGNKKKASYEVNDPE